jgi:hypothetical protein
MNKKLTGNFYVFLGIALTLAGGADVDSMAWWENGGGETRGDEQEDGEEDEGFVDDIRRHFDLGSL